MPEEMIASSVDQSSIYLASAYVDTAKFVDEPVVEKTPVEEEKVVVHGGKVYSFIKRMFDIVASGLFLLLFGWVIGILMIIKWLEDLGVKSYKLEITEDENGKYLGKDNKRYTCKLIRDVNGEKDPTVHGPLYTSDRVGKNGKIFKFHKIRSMCPGAEKMKVQLLSYGINEADAPAFKLKDDSRITKFGKFLRRTSLDELPQIWDIFRGKMSIIGPRSPIPEDFFWFIDKLISARLSRNSEIHYLDNELRHSGLDHVTALVVKFFQMGQKDGCFSTFTRCGKELLQNA